MTRILLETLQKVADLRWLKLFTVQYVRNSGTIGNWQFASRKALPQLDGSPLDSDGVFIVPLRTAPDGRRLVMTREFRIPLGTYEYSFPAGLGEAGESAETSIRRELLEETGLALTKLRLLSPPVASSAGLTDESATLAFVDCEGSPHTGNAEESEDIEIVELDFAEMCALRRSNVTFSSRAWLILLMFEAHGKLEWPAAISECARHD